MIATKFHRCTKHMFQMIPISLPPTSIPWNIIWVRSGHGRNPRHTHHYSSGSSLQSSCEKTHARWPLYRPSRWTQIGDAYCGLGKVITVDCQEIVFLPFEEASRLLLARAPLTRRAPISAWISHWSRDLYGTDITYVGKRSCRIPLYLHCTHGSRKRWGSESTCVGDRVCMVALSRSIYKRKRSPGT